LAAFPIYSEKSKRGESRAFRLRPIQETGMHDLLIKGATIVDGTGAEPFVADVAVSEGVITAVGKVDGAAKRTIDAQGAHLLPGFVDIHTHYDGQVSWDETFTPSIYHGVTTLVMGNCGVGFAPVRPGQEDRLIDLMQGVEEIPESVLTEGITWGWESFTDYCKAMDAMPHSLDFATLLPHDSLRLYVMGERAAKGESANAEDLQEMVKLLREGLIDGAIGFSMGSTETHRTAQGQMTPSFQVSPDEMNALATAFHGLPYRVLQAVDDFSATRCDPKEEKSRFDREYTKIEAMAREAGRPVTISWMDRVFAPMQSQWLAEAAVASGEKGVDVRLACAPRGVGVLAGLDTTMNLFIAFPSYREIMGLPAAERAARMRDPELRARILAEKPIKLAVEGSSVPPVLDFVVAHFNHLAMDMFPCVETNGSMDYEPERSKSLGAMAQAKGVGPLEVMYDYLTEGTGTNFIYYPIFNYTTGDLSKVRDMLMHPKALYSLGDGGAHVGTICDASSTTTMLAHWALQRTRGPRLPLPMVVNMLTQRNAEFLGLKDRGVIAVGKKADLNLVNLDELGLPVPQIVRDLPAGGRRIVQKARGYIATFVSGEAVTENGEITAARPGRWARAQSA
jgi:N-acyl-D-aspartate/D-glutamate deacylase